MCEVRSAASVILVRTRASTGQLEVFLVRRHKRASFMSSAFVFPGGVADDGERDTRATAARELFEEAGILLSRTEIPAAVREQWRTRLNDGGESLGDLLAGAGAELDLDSLHYFAHWVTPSAEKRRYSARFYIAELPAGQTPSFDNQETVDEIWVTPDEALERAGQLRLPPPQVRTLYDLRACAREGLAAVLAEAAERERDPHPILPRLAPLDVGFALLLPWDPDYAERGTGDAIEMRGDHPLAVGPSRFVLRDDTWNNVFADDPVH